MIPKCFSQSESNASLTEGEIFLGKADSLFGIFEDRAASEYFQQALPLLEQEQKWDSLAKCYNGLYGIYYYAEEYQEAEAYGQLAFSNAEKHLAPSSDLYNIALNNLGSYYSRVKGDYDKAIELLYQAVETANEPELLATYYNNIGYNLRRKGDFTEGKRLYEKAAALLEEEVSATNSKLAINYKNRAYLLGAIGETETAIALYHDALQILAVPENQPLIDARIDIHQTLVRQYTKLKQTDSAQYHLNQALALEPMAKQFQWDYHYRILGDISLQKANYSELLSIRKKELAAYRSRLENNPKHPRVAESYQRLADAHSFLGQFEEALPAYQRALELVSSVDSLDSRFENPPLDKFLYPIDAISIVRAKASTLMNYYEEKKELDYAKSAMESYQLAAKLIARTRRELQSEGSKLILAEQNIPTLEEALRTAQQLYQLTNEPAYQDLFFELLEQNKATLLYESLRAAQAKNTLGIPDSLLEQENQVRADLAFYQKQLFQANHKTKGTDPTLLKGWKDLVFSLQQAGIELERRLEQEYPAYYQLKYGTQTLNPAQVQAQYLDSSAALVEYFWGDSSLFVFCISQQGIASHEIPLDQALNQQLDQLTRMLTDREQVIRAGQSAATIAAFSTAASQLYLRLLAPVLPEGITELIVVPDGKLNQLPFDLLLTETSAVSDFRDCAFLLKQMQVSYAYSATLRWRSDQSQSSSNKETYAGFAPIYTEGFAELKSNQQEVADIAQLLGGDEYLQTEATEQAFKAAASDYDILHLAMHAFVDNEVPAYSSLIFDQTSVVDSSENEGILHAYELYNMQIPAQLAVLSACHTGEGKLARGEGVLSLARAFRYAGCSSIVMSLWQADDKTTRLMMNRFFHHLNEGMDKSLALRQAKLDYLESAELVHPYYWGAFVLIGENEPIEIPSSFPWMWVLVGMVLIGITAYSLRKIS